MNTIKKVALWNARTGGIDEVPVERGFNGGAGVAHYLEKRINGRQVFYPLAQIESLSDAEKAKLRIEVPGDAVLTKARGAATGIEAQLAGLSDEERAKVLAKFAPKPAEKGGKS
jgi:hypothetical protein